MTALIIGGSVVTDIVKINEKIKDYKYDVIIACDRGYDNAKKLGIKPHIVVGDFDSIKEKVKDASVIKLPPEKDDTDLKVAVQLAIEKKCSDIFIICATGGRLDHFYGNMSLLEYIYKKGVSGIILDEQNKITISKNQNTEYKNISKYISIIPIDEQIEITTKNLKYEATNLKVFRDNIISISNESISENFSIHVIQGKAYIIQSDN